MRFWAAAGTSVGIASAFAASGLLLGQTLGCLQFLGLQGESFLRDSGAAVVVDTGAPPVQADAGPKCAAGTKECNGGCVPTDDPQYGCAAADCAPCSVPFAATLKCDQGRCSHATCKPGRASCDGRGENGCEADLLDPKTCGTCDVACQTGQVCNPSPTGPNTCASSCTAGLTNCSGSCVSTSDNLANCGGCSRACPAGTNGDPSCVAGSCKVDCRSGFADCNGDPSTCEALRVFYRDGDGDGAGVTGATVQACTPPAGYAALAGDCHDGNKDVFPGQKNFFSQPYTTTSLGLSFDYDCDGVEEEQNTPPHWTGSCGANCVGGGVEASGPTKNPFCGSTTAYVCGVAVAPSNVSLHPTTGSPPTCNPTRTQIQPLACR